MAWYVYLLASGWSTGAVFGTVAFCSFWGFAWGIALVNDRDGRMKK